MDAKNDHMEIDINLIRIDGGTQMRAELNEKILDEYFQALGEGVEFPPLVVFFDGGSYWLADGFHRYFAMKKKGISKILCRVNSGSKRDAVLYAAGANERHGLRRNDADRAKACETLLLDDEWGNWAVSRIAEVLKVSRQFVYRTGKRLGIPKFITNGEQKEGKKITQTKYKDAEKSFVGPGVPIQVYPKIIEDRPSSGKGPHEDIVVPLSPLLDKNRVVVPEQLRDIFMDNTLNQAIKYLNVLQQQFISPDFQKNFPYLRMHDVNECIKKLICHLEDAIPQTVHKECGGHGCVNCRHCGYLNRQVL